MHFPHNYNFSHTGQEVCICRPRRLLCHLLKTAHEDKEDIEDMTTNRGHGGLCAKIKSPFCCCNVFSEIGGGSGSTPTRRGRRGNRPSKKTFAEKTLMHYEKLQIDKIVP